MTLEQQVTVMSAAGVLRALQADGDMRIYLNILADRVNRGALNQEEKQLRTVRSDIMDLRSDLVAAGGLDNTILSSGLSGVNKLILMGM